MPWTDAECQGLFMAYWEQGGATCPTCQRTPVRFNHTQFMGGYVLMGNCPRGCGNFQMSNTADPNAGTFRDWTPEEQEKVADAHFANQSVNCPVDGARVNVSENAYFGGTIVSAMCPRCGQHMQRNFPRS